ncbi:MAG: arylsulfatase [Bryobacterales bacterium]|nr:arylsulfatase [Acidobacteriota bacterium]MCB9385961.1 arylsulfatase [Bryobacterales bacterium]
MDLSTRRQFLSGLGLAAGLAACGETSQPAKQAAKRPNVLLIMADDMGFSDIGCYGGEVQTPNLDALAAQGLRFRQFYNAARCCPTRASLMTGLYQHQAGVGHMVNDLGAPGYQGYLNDKCVTIAEALTPAGYVTMISGKWHVGETPERWPDKRGFQRAFGLISGGSNYFKLDTARQMALDGEPWTPPDDGSFYMTDAFADHAVRFLGESASGDAPFFLYLPFTAPHWPLHAREEDIAAYKGKYAMGWDALREQRYNRMREMGVIDASWPLSPRDEESMPWEQAENKELEQRRMEVYAAQITAMDRAIGRVLDKVRSLGKMEDTLVLFLADNGGCHETADIPQGTPRNTWGDPNAMPGPSTSFDAYGLPWANASNVPFRRFKSWVHEGGISSPLICHWPNGITQQAGAWTDSPGHIIDVMATCLDLAGAGYPADKTPVEGKSLRPIFEEGKRAPHDALFWEHQGNRAVRMGDWKLVARNGSEWELYNLATDRSELDDQSGKMPEKVAELQKAYDDWAARAGVVDWAELKG